jgi:putative hemolysin
MAFELIVLLFLVLLNGFFSLAEMAVVSSRKARLRHEAARGKSNYKLALETAENPSRFLSTIQVVITLIGTLVGAFGGATVARSLEEALGAFPALKPSAGPVSIGIVVVLTSFVSVVLGELVPKSIALSRPEAIAAAVIGHVSLFARLFAPLSRLLSAITGLLVSLLGVKPSGGSSVTEDDVRILIAQGAEDGVLEEREREMVEGVLSLGDIRATSLMTPRTEVVLVDLRQGPDVARRAIVENSRYGFIPAVEGDPDKVVGLLPVKECLAAIASGTFDDPRVFVKNGVYLPESASALRAIAAIKASEVKSALILDEYGGVSGLVALSDLVEAIVGEIPSTGDEDEPEMTRRQDGSFLVDGSMPFSRFAQELGIADPPEGDYDTIAGLVLELMGTIPRAGESCRWRDLRLEVVDMDGNRIDKLLVERVSA